jgi:hypothetical protein
MIDDPNSKRLTDSQLDAVIEGVHDDLYGDILDQAAYFNSQYQQIGIPLRAPGYIDLRLTTYGGDLTQRFYRLQQCIADGRHYFAKDPRDYLMVAKVQDGTVTSIAADAGVEQRFTFQFLGNQLWLHPLGQVTTFVELRYNYKPVPFTQLTNGTIVDMPEGSNRALINLSAAEALPKGNAEDAAQFRAMGAEARDKMLNSIRRQYHGATQIYEGSNSWGWGST